MRAFLLKICSWFDSWMLTTQLFGLKLFLIVVALACLIYVVKLNIHTNPNQITATPKTKNEIKWYNGKINQEISIGDTVYSEWIPLDSIRETTKVRIVLMGRKD